MKSFASILTVLTLAVIIAAQDNNFRVAGRCGAARGSGFVNPICGGEAGGTVSDSKGRVALDLTAFYLIARKRPGGGHNIGGDTALRIHVGNGYFIGPAAGYNRQTTNFYTKSAWSVGGEGGRVSPSGNVVLSARFLQDVTSVNRSRSYTGKLEWFGPRKVYVAGRFGAADFKCNQGAFGLTDHCWSTQGSVSAGFYFK